jgi:hypothetical protein
LIRPHLGQRLTSILLPLSHEVDVSMLLIRRYVIVITYVFGERRFTAATDKPSQNCRFVGEGVRFAGGTC